MVRVDEKSSILQEVIDVLTRSFCGTTKTAPDAVTDWCFSGVREKGTFCPLPEAPSTERLAWYNYLVTLMTQFGLNRGGVYALVDKISRKVAAATVTCPPRAVPFAENE